MKSAAYFSFFLTLMLGGCATDVVLKPAVTSFVADGRKAAAAVGQSYVDISNDTNRATAMMIAAHPECGLNATIYQRTEKDDAFLRTPAAQSEARIYARTSGLKNFAVPGKGKLCLSADEIAVIGQADRSRVLAGTPVRLAAADAFEPQLDTIDGLVSYLAALASSAADPKLVVEADIADAAAKFKAAGSDAKAVADALKILSAPDSVNAANILKEKGAVDDYAGAIGALADSVENYIRQADDVRAIRAKLLDPNDDFDARVTAIGADADRWNAVHRLIRQDILIATSEAISPHLAEMDFDSRVKVVEAFLGDLEAAAPRPRRPVAAGMGGAAGADAGGGGAAPAEGAIRPSPFGDMMRAIAKSHDELKGIAAGHYSPAMRHKLAMATLGRLATTLKDIAAVAALFI